jgi:Zn-finger nucleic acid-binding protein
MDFSCPACNVLLEAQTLEGVRLWKCASCRGFAISLPTVRKGLKAETFKNIWQKLSSGQTETGRPCPGCEKPLKVVEAGGQGGVIKIDVCRTCHILWFDETEFSELPKVVPQAEPEGAPVVNQEKRFESRLLTPEELTFAAFEEEQYRRRSFLLKLLDGSIARELGLDSFFGELSDD